MHKESITERKGFITKGLDFAASGPRLTRICCLCDIATQNFDSAIGKYIFEFRCARENENGAARDRFVIPK
jgi:hypothetical protein